MTNDVMLGGLYLLMAMVLVVGALINRREPFAKMLKMALAWVLIFGAGFVVFSFRDDLGYVAERLKSEATGTPLVAEEGAEVRVPMAIDGHFWVDAQVNGVPVRFLVDSGATVTTIERSVADAVGVPVSSQRVRMVRTGNGVIRVAAARAETVEIASIRRENVALHVTDNLGGEPMNVLGMNFLSSLRRWSVEGRWLVLHA